MRRTLQEMKRIYADAKRQELQEGAAVIQKNLWNKDLHTKYGDYSRPRRTKTK